MDTGRAVDTGGVGRRIAYWRERRGYTQADFGRLMGQSKRWVQDFEGGKRQADPRLSVLARAAQVLRVPLEHLLADGPPDRSAVVAAPAGALAFVDALYQYDALAHPDLRDEDPPSPAQLRRRIAYCCEAFQACHYAALSRQLPDLLLHAQRAAASVPVQRECEAQALLSRVFQLTASVLHKYGQAAAVQAAVASDRALAAAERSGDPVQIGAASRRVAKSLVQQNRPQSAVDFAMAAARRLTGDLAASGPLGLSTLGMLYLNAAIAASAQPHSTAAVRTAMGYVDEAREVARLQGADLNEDWTMFGPTNVELYRVDVLMRCEDGWSALDAADGIDTRDLESMTKERRAQHHLTRARAALLVRRNDDAVESILEAERFAGEEVHGRRSGIGLVQDVIDGTLVPSGRLRALAERCGLRA
ncbi:helix-turn-helix domain-containing protein [Streptomyces silvensis]|uniref:helix-turn-helix domain-containing protein n=1 Tax=Streptomyces silvensis TaxID=1765722 RepID=UPI000AB2C1E8|nr:helix-turn-helix transcriptional regulator [Streptomyces silvensis]